MTSSHDAKDERRIEVSVVVPTRNRPIALRETLASLRRQDFPGGGFEVVVVDDGSNPPVGYGESPQDWACRVVRREGVERSAARNAGAETAVGEILVFVDDDVTVGRDFLSAHRAAQREWPGVLAVGQIDLPEKLAERPFVRFRQALERAGMPSQRGIVTAANFCTAQNMSITREAFLGLGGFSEDMVSSEDQDLALRHTRAGGRIAFLPEARGLHCDWALDIASYCRRVEWGSEYMIPFCRRHPLWPDNVERERVNGQLRLGSGFLGQIPRRLLKKALGQAPALAILFGGTRMVERWAPDSRLLDRLYRALIGVHIFRGHRRGAKRFGRVSPPARP